jgi:hypothetical protein
MTADGRARLSNWLRAPTVAAIAAVVLVGLAVELLHSRSHAGWVESLVELLSMSHEQNVPTWFASSLLLSCGALLVAIAADVRRRGERFRWHWTVLAALFFYFSLDEAAEIHERLGGLFATGGLLYFDWVLPGAAFVALVAAVYWPFLRHLDRRTRRRFLLAGALYVGGALVLELPLGYWTERHGADNLTYGLLDLVEETLELAGAGYFLFALADYWQDGERGQSA